MDFIRIGLIFFNLYQDKTINLHKLLYATGDDYNRELRHLPLNLLLSKSDIQNH